jgi:hypothetical protein
LVAGEEQTSFALLHRRWIYGLIRTIVRVADLSDLPLRVWDQVREFIRARGGYRLNGWSRPADRSMRLGAGQWEGRR